MGLSLLVPAVDAAMAVRGLNGWYLSLARPPGTPSGRMVLLVWLGLYAAMGVSGWLAWRSLGPTAPVRLWGWLLLASALWAPVFFGLHSVLGGLLARLAELALAGWTLAWFRRASLAAACLLVPYAAWILYATGLAGWFWWLNRGLGGM